MRVQCWAGCLEGACGLWRAPMPQPSRAATGFCAPPRPQGPQGGYWGFGGIFVLFLASFQFQSGQPLLRTASYTAASLNERDCGKPLCSEMGVYVMLGLGMAQNRSSAGYGSRAVQSPCSRRDQAHCCCRQMSSLCYRSDPPL